MTLAAASRSTPRRFTSSVVVDRPADEVAAVVLDWGHDVRWRAAVRGFEVEPAGPAVVGQRLVEELVVAGMTFRTPTTVVEAATRSASYAGGSARVAVAGRREVEELGPARCRVTTSTEITGRGAMRLLVPLLAPSYRRSDAADLRRLAALLD